MGVSLFVIFLVVTGWALNHTAELGLARLSMKAPWIAAWYGLRGDVPSSSFSAGGHWLVATENGALLDGKPTQFKLANVIGMSTTGELIAIASRDELVLANTQGRLVDRIAVAQLPSGAITRIGSAQNQIVLQGATTFASGDGANWQAFSGAVQWSMTQPLSGEQLAAAKQLAPGIPLERVMQDVHSGRVLGRYGHYLVDAIGLLFLLLAGSGLWMFFRRR